MYSDKTNKYEIVTKDTLIFELMHERGCDIRDFIDVCNDEIKPSIKTRTNNFLNRLETDKVYYKRKAISLKTAIYNNTKTIKGLK